MKIRRIVNGVEMEFELTAEEIEEARELAPPGGFSVEQYQRVLGAAAEMAASIDDLREVQAEPGTPNYWALFGKCLDKIFGAREAYLRVQNDCVLENAEAEHLMKADGLCGVLKDAEERSMRHCEKTPVDRMVEEIFDDLTL